MTLHCLGSIANNLISHNQDAVVYGTTSRGIFLRLAVDWILFITDEVYPGPLSLNLACRLERSSLPNPGTIARISQHVVSFEQPKWIIDTRQTEVWSAPARQGEWLPVAERTRILSSILDLCLTSKKNYPLLPLLCVDQDLLQPFQGLQPHYKSLQRFFQQPTFNQTQERLADLLGPFIGAGQGLTPAGDDMILGVLLALSRWGDRIGYWPSSSQFHRVFLPTVYSKTTLLSANLIECALNGQADERLLSALDGLVIGTLDAASIFELLSQWGSSSGMDALVGMALVLSIR
jgi:hypothetical protein